MRLGYPNEGWPNEEVVIVVGRGVSALVAEEGAGEGRRRPAECGRAKRGGMLAFVLPKARCVDALLKAVPKADSMSTVPECLLIALVVICRGRSGDGESVTAVRIQRCSDEDTAARVWQCSSH